MLPLVPAAQDDAPPTTPQGLRANAYSGTAGAIHWQRSTDDGGVVPGYEISRDGAVLGVFDALSYVDFTLAPGTLYRYTVTAIDLSGQRSESAAVTLLTRGDGPDRADGVPAPGGLRAAVYSSTAAEIFWDRPDDSFGLVFEVRRDGELLQTTDGTSFFDDSLSAATDYRFDVIAVDRDGARSSASAVSVTTAAGGNPLPPASELVAPDITSIAIYSGTAAELFWRRPPTGSPVARVEVSRDGVVLGTTDGTSFFDDTRSPGEDYEYTLVAIANDGTRSDAGTSDPGMNGNETDSLRADNLVDVIAAIFDAYRGEPWGDIALALPNFPRAPEFPFERTELVCQNGGTAAIDFIDTSQGIGRGYLFDDCQENDTVFDGAVENFQQNFQRVVSRDGLTLTEPTRTIEYSGFVIDGRDGLDAIWLVTEPLRYALSAADGDAYLLHVEDRLEYQYGTDRASGRPRIVLSGAIELSTGQTGGDTLRIETLEPLARQTVDGETGQPLPVADDWTFTTGRMRVEADDGSMLLLEAENGDEASARITVTDSKGETTVIDQAWEVWLDNLRFE